MRVPAHNELPPPVALECEMFGKINARHAPDRASRGQFYRILAPYRLEGRAAYAPKRSSSLSAYFRLILLSSTLENQKLVELSEVNCAPGQYVARVPLLTVNSTVKCASDEFIGSKL